MTHPCTAVQPSTRRSTARPQPLRWLRRAVARLYPDRPLAGLGQPVRSGELPTRPYAELGSLNRYR